MLPNAAPGSQQSESLVKRLAGPSTGKAGLAKDQTEINRVIAEASKGSKFYENEKRKDKDLTERISKILKQRDSVCEGVDLTAVEASVDQMLLELESNRDLSQMVVHIDMDAFFANVELLRNPKLAGKPFGVGRGVLSTASYEARKFGVRSGMAGFIAKKLCPELIMVSQNLGAYTSMSQQIMAILRRYDPNMDAVGCDESFLNITEYCRTHSLSPETCVERMRAEVHSETKLTASAGIAPNKMLAKICSDQNKPNGQFMMPFERQAIRSFMHDLPIRKIPGIGRVNERLLESIGVKTCGDIFSQRAIISLMDKQFGLTFLLRTYLGISSNVVRPRQRAERKSIGSERTFKPLDSKEQILRKLDEIAAELERDMQETGWCGRTVTLKFKLDTYQVFNRAKSFNRWITSKEDLYATGKELLLPEFPLRLRLIGLRVTKLKDLRAQPEAMAGIKRFFDAPKGRSPRKKAKFSEEEPNESNALHVEDLRADEDEMDETMPDFHENDEDDDPLSQQREWEQEFIRQPMPRPRSCSPSEIEMILNQEAIHDESAREDQVGQSTHTPSSVPTQVHNCPICARTLDTDNEGLNSHIDFCLSRGEILKVQIEATKSGAGTKRAKRGGLAQAKRNGAKKG